MIDDALSLIGPLVGGLGLFLLGTSSMSDGLKLAAAPLAPPGGAGTAIAAAHATFVQWADALLAPRDPTLGQADAAAVGNALQAAEDAYQDLKAALLVAGAAGGVHVGEMESTLRRYSAMRRAVQQAAKAAQWRLAPAPQTHDAPQPAHPPHAH